MVKIILIYQLVVKSEYTLYIVYNKDLSWFWTKKDNSN